MKTSILFQRLEAAFLFLASTYFYFYFDFDILWFIVLLFTIDIFMMGYLVNERIGAYLYNIGHSVLIPLTLFVLSALLPNNAMLGLGLIWLAHIGMDRMMGYGLKDTSGFTHTHLGRIGKK